MKKTYLPLLQDGELALRAEIADKELTLLCLRQGAQVLRLPMHSFFLKGETDSTCAYDDGVLRRSDCRFLEAKPVCQTSTHTVLCVRGEFAQGDVMQLWLVAFADAPLIYMRGEIENSAHADYFTLHWMQAALPAKLAHRVAVSDPPRVMGEAELSHLLFATDPFSAFSRGSYRGLCAAAGEIGVSLLGCGCAGAGIADDTLYLCPHYDLGFDNARLAGHAREDLGLWLHLTPLGANGDAALCEHLQTAQQAVAQRADALHALLAQVCRADSQPPAAQREYLLQSGALRVSLLLRADKSAVLAKVEDTQTGALLYHSADVAFVQTPLFSARLRDASQKALYLGSHLAWGAMDVQEVRKGVHRLVFTAPQAAETGGVPEALQDFCVTLTIHCDNGSLQFALEHTPLPDGWQLEEYQTAPLPLKEAWPQAALAYPKGEGAALEDAFVCKPSLRYEYPTQLFAMPFFALYGGGRGIYFGAHDANATAKELYADYAESTRQITLRSAARTTDTIVVWKLFDGDWYDAALLYKAWVDAAAPWAQTRLHIIPDWMNRIVLWLNVSANTQNWVQEVLAVQKAVGAPVGVHLYHWHVIAFDNDYPHYLPAKQGVAQGIALLQASGVRVMPYINGRLWDTRDREDTDWQFTSVALPAVCKRADGAPIVESYASRERDGSRVLLGVMCPSHTVWAEKIAQLVYGICCGLGADGVYIDQIAAAPQAPCRDASHSHAPGYGGWWVQAYRALLQRAYGELPPDKVLTTESCAEVYADMVDGFLTWHCQLPGQRPMLPLIYASRVRLFGRAYADETDALTTRATLAQQLVFAEQPGWFSEKILRQPHFSFVRQVVRLRAKLGDMLQQWQMQRPLDIAADAPSTGLFLDWYPQQALFAPIQTGVFADDTGARLLLVLANIGAQAQRVSLHDVAAQYGISAPCTAVLLTADGSAVPQSIDRANPLVLPGESAAAVLFMKEGG